ncbi:BrnA antitoxin family protein [Sphingobium sufflavum]|uniref:BrnA antitoxin family protein n=1 Tax=Sphingobium sufflavum TaxID=1129547 RepID=UPI001F285315|nr:BrnA antitoxin family protein [Sphingobium sufflavum]MCE7798654.1 BrnA antitoxin family protein [Sphingobium sufflavum]
MTKNVKNSGENWIDPDDAPPLTQQWFDGADVYRGTTLVRRGRPKQEKTKQHVSLRLDPEVIESFKAAGPGWQVRINEALRKAAGL